MLEAVSNPVRVAIFFYRFASLICQKEADDPMILNLNFTYTGATPIIGPAPLGTFSAVSNFGQSHPGYFAAEGTLNLDGTKVDNVGVLPSAGAGNVDFQLNPRGLWARHCWICGFMVA